MSRKHLDTNAEPVENMKGNIGVGEAEKNDRFIEFYGSLLNSKERKELLDGRGAIKEIGDIPRRGWRLSFDKRSRKHKSAALNLVETGERDALYFTKVFKADKQAFTAIMEREMGKKTAQKWLKGEKVPDTSYLPVKMPSEFGETYIFLIPEKGRVPILASEKDEYVKIVQDGIKECFEGEKQRTNLQVLNLAIEQSLAERRKLENIVDMGLTFSAMIRLYTKRSKESLHNQILAEVQEVFGVESREDFVRVHSEICSKLVKELQLAKGKNSASYGQVAKTLDVVLKVVIYYCHLPNCGKARVISKWLNPAVDTKMMAFLGKYLKKRNYQAPNEWPRTVRQVEETTYEKIQDTVRKFIEDAHHGKILPIQFDDIYWNKLNR